VKNKNWWTNPYIIKEQAFGGGAYSCVNNVSTQAPPPKWNMPKHAHHRCHAQTCPPPDVVAVMTQSLMTQQPASPPDVYSIAVMTKSSSKVLGRFPTIKSITGRWLSYRKRNSKTVRLYARQKFPGFDRGSGYSYKPKQIKVTKLDGIKATWLQWRFFHE
jgi:hypothetical protein